MSANSKIQQTHHRLSIHIGVNGLSFVIQDTHSQECLLWQNHTYSFPGNDYNEWAKEVGNVFRQEDILQKRFNHCDVMIDTHKHTLIPSSIFEAEQAIEVLRQLFEVAYLDEVNYSGLVSQEATCIYALPAPVNAMVFKYQHKARFYASVMPLLHFIIGQKEYSRALMHYTHSHVDLVLMQGERLLLCNSYAIDRFSTALYFLLFALKQWQLNPGSLNLYISGPFKPTHTKQLCNYFPSVTVATSPTGLFPSEALSLQYGPHFFPVCESSVEV